MASSSASSSTSSTTDTPRVAVPAEYFVYVGEAEKDGNSLYRCLKCPTGIAGKKISAHDTSRLNLKKHIQVCYRLYAIHWNY